MSSRPEEVVFQLYQAVERGNMLAVRDLVHHEATWVQHGEGDHAGKVRGPSGVEAYFMTLHRVTHGSYQVELEDLHEGDEEDEVIAILKCRAKRRGVELTWREAGVFRVEDGHVIEAELHPEDEAAGGVETWRYRDFWTWR